MSHPKPALYLVTIRTRSSVSEAVIEAGGLQDAVSSAFSGHHGITARPRTWTPRPGRQISEARLLSLKSDTGSIQVTAEHLTA